MIMPLAIQSGITEPPVPYRPSQGTDTRNAALVTRMAHLSAPYVDHAFGTTHDWPALQINRIRPACIVQTHARTPTAARFKKLKNKRAGYSVLNECPHEHDFTTLGLLILKPDPIRLSM